MKIRHVFLVSSCLALVCALGASTAGAQTLFTNTDAEVLSIMAADGVFQHEGAARVLRLDDGADAYRTLGAEECAGVLHLALGAADTPGLSGLTAVVRDLEGRALAATSVAGPTRAETLLVPAGHDVRVEIGFTLGADRSGSPATFTRTLEGRVGCDAITRLALDLAGPSKRPARGAVDVSGFAATTDLAVAATTDLAVIDAADLLVDLDPTSSRQLAPAIRQGRAAAKSSSLTCAADGFDTLEPQWQLANIGDADQGSVVVSGGQLALTTDGTSLYHGTDNGAFVYQQRTDGFRMEIDITGFPVNPGGGFQKAGIMVRESNSPTSPRVFVQFVPNNPFTGTSSLQFDYRGLDGVARELASTPMGLSLPLRLAVDRRGDTFTAYFSTDGGNSWVRPAGAAGGSITIPMADTVNVGVMGASYQANQTLTATFDDFRLCEPNTLPLPQPPPGVVCQPGRPLDLVHVVDASGSMTNPFGPGETKLDAVRNAMAAMHDLLEQDLPGSRAALLAFSGRFNDQPYNTLANTVSVLANLTSDLDSVDAAAQGIDQSMIHPDSTTPLPFALQATTNHLSSLGNLASLPVVVLWTDGFPNVDLQGYDALFYTNQELRELTLYDGNGNFMPWGQVAWMGRYNPLPGTYDGEVFANSMVEIENMKNTVPDTLLYGIAIQSDSIFKLDLLEYGAWYTGADVLSVQNSITLVEGLRRIVDGLDCGADIGDYVWNDANGDGVQDPGEVGLAGVTLQLFDPAGNLVASTVTDADGGYLFADVAAGTYTVRVDDSTLPPLVEATYDLDGLATSGSATVTVVDDQVLDTVDFGYRVIAAATIGDRVWEDTNGDGVQDAGELGLAGVTVTLLDSTGQGVDTAVTDGNGEYSFEGLAAGSYTVVVDDSTLPAGITIPTYDLDGTATSHTAAVTVAEGEINLDLDFGYQARAGEPWCPRTPGYWKNHLEVWPVGTLQIGGVTYGVSDLLGFLSYGGPDASSRLARHLTATLLNLAMGSDPSIQGTVDDANAFLADNPPGSNPKGRKKGQANAIKDVLDAYNNIPCDDD